MQRYRYPGLKPFSVDEQNLFFGRDEDISKLSKLIKLEKSIVLFSKSGLGKTSLLNAGIFPRIERETDFVPLTVRFGAFTKEFNNNLFDKFAFQAKIDSTQTSFLNLLIENENSLWFHFKQKQINEKRKSFLLLFDQFEEFFSFPVEQQLVFKQQLRDLLFTQIPQNFRDALDENYQRITPEQEDTMYEPLDIKAVFAIRSDMLSRLDTMKDIFPDLLLHTYELAPMNTAQACDAILKPAQRQPESEYFSPCFTFEKTVIPNILNFLSSNGQTFIESFQLQTLCQHIEQNIVIKNSDLYVEPHDLGDLKAIYENFYLNLIEKLPAAEQIQAQMLIEDNLVIENVRINLNERVITGKLEISTVLLKKLEDAHLLRAEDSHLGRTYGISHDTLVEPILKNRERRLEQLRKEEELRIKNEELRIEKEKAEKERQEREKESKRQRKVIVIVSIAGLIALAFGIFGFAMYFKAETEREKTQKALVEVTHQKEETQKALDAINNEKVRKLLELIGMNLNLSGFDIAKSQIYSCHKINCRDSSLLKRVKKFEKQLKMR